MIFCCEIMNLNQKKLVYWGLLILWLLTIFYFSNQPGHASTHVSNHVTGFMFHRLSGLLIFIVRKTAHISEFLILTLLSYNVFRLYSVSLNRTYIFTFLFSILCAALDEFHQLFVAGRECLIRDVFIDLIGIIIAILIIIIIKKVRNKESISVT